MVFSSLLFLFIFLPLFLITYFIVPKAFQNFILFMASLIFYAWGEPIYVLIMIFSTILDYSCGRIIHHYRHNKKIKRLALITSIIVNLGMLGYFKYSGLAALPIGISFYTFQTMSYTIDLYRDKINVQKNIITFGAYVAMFPQLIAGPIVTYNKVEEELNHRKVTLESFGEGSLRFIEGLGKKVLLANNIGLLWDTLSKVAFNELTMVGAWLGMIAFALQLYFDFSGYSDMAIGLGKMLGFHFPENFNYPYLSKSISEFWRRWHMTLGSWFREYVYIPLGGNRVSRGRLFFNLFAVWFLTGLWHGAGWNFVLWGLFFWVLIMLERSILSNFFQHCPSFINHIYLLVSVLLSFVLFSHDSLRDGISYFKAMFHFNGASLINTETLYLLKNYSLLLVIGVLFATPLMKKIRNKSNDFLLYIFYVGVLVLSTAYLVDSTFNPFLYFRF